MRVPYFRKLPFNPQSSAALKLSETLDQYSKEWYNTNGNMLLGRPGPGKGFAYRL